MRQMGSTRDMVFTVPHLVAFISSVMTLEPGDVILTGTPAGVGPLVDGDEVTVDIEGLGSLSNPVRAGMRGG
jgi:2-keto-4-pentenoate hydratase/2-oxohepta-3-ene-1,7-dioic acid hydratase in catechol pathway